MKAIWYAVTALILVIASVILALIVVGFAFGLFGAIGGQGAVYSVGTGYIEGSNGHYTLVVTLNNQGSTSPVIESISIQAIPVSIVGGDLTLMPATISQYTITINAPNLVLQPGSQVNVAVSLSNGQVVQVAAVYTG
jgi:hypothetical protein